MGLILLILVAIVAEILTWIVVGNFIGSGWYVFFWFIAAFFIGLSLLRSSVAHIMPQIQNMQGSGQIDQDPQVGKYLTRAIAGFLLMIPGLLSDVLALLMLIPAVQNALKHVVMRAMQKRQQAMMEKMMGGMGMMGGTMNGATGQGSPFADLMRQMQDMQEGGYSSRRQDSNVIDGEAVEIESEHKRIDASKDKF